MLRRSVSSVVSPPPPACKKQPVREIARQRDDRFRRLLSDAAWRALPAAVQRRFSKKATFGTSIIYRGATVRLRSSLAGRALANLARLVGAPLPLGDDATGRAAVATVTEDPQSDGQVWTRIYARGAGFPQMINSVKRFCGPTGLEEQIGGGVSVSLALSVEDGALVFSSVDYFVQVFGRRRRLPRALSPGVMRVAHRDLGDGVFAFSFRLSHPLFGLLVEQETVFHDMEEARHDL